MANSEDPDQTAPIGIVCSGSMLFASILNLSVMLGNYLQQTSSADDIFGCLFFLGALRVNSCLADIFRGGSRISGKRCICIKVWGFAKVAVFISFFLNIP